MVGGGDRREMTREREGREDGSNNRIQVYRLPRASLDQLLTLAHKRLRNGVIRQGCCCTGCDECLHSPPALPKGLCRRGRECSPLTFSHLSQSVSQSLTHSLTPRHVITTRPLPRTTSTKERSVRPPLWLSFPISRRDRSSWFGWQARESSQNQVEVTQLCSHRSPKRKTKARRPCQGFPVPY